MGVELLAECDGSFWALQHTGATGDAAVDLVQDDDAGFVIGRPAADGTNLVALPDAAAFVWIELDLQAT